MKATEAMAKGFNLATENIALLGILFVVNLVLTGISTAILGTTPPTAAEQAAAVIGKMLVLIPILVLIGIFLQGGLLGVYRDKIKTGTLPLNMFAAYGGRYYLRLLGLGLLVMLILGVIGLIGVAIAAAFGAVGGGANAILGILAALVVLVTFVAELVFGLPLLYSGYVLVADDSGIIASIKTSFSFVKQYWGRVLVLFLLLILFAFGLELIVGLITVLLGKINVAVLTTMFTLVLRSIVNSFVSILMVGSLMTLYLSLSTPAQPAAQQ